VISDLLGMFTDFVPRHAKQYAKLGDETRRAVSEYIAEVTQGQFPTAKQSFSMDAALVEEIERSL